MNFVNRLKLKVVISYAFQIKIICCIYLSITSNFDAIRFKLTILFWWYIASRYF